MAGKNEVTIRVTGDISDVDGKLNKVGDDLDKLGNKSEQTGKKGGASTWIVCTGPLRMFTGWTIWPREIPG